MVHQLGALAIILMLALPMAVLARPSASVALCQLPNKVYMPNVLGISEGPEVEPQRGAAGKLQADFNGDGCADLAVGAFLTDFLGTNGADHVTGAGHVEIFYGANNGLSESGQVVRPPIPKDLARFGYEIAAGDFNNDGYSDMAVGAPGYLVSGQDSAGAVYVFPGSPQGIDPENWVEWHQDTPGVPGGAETGDFFGRTLATGDFDGDNHSDLAIGIPDEAIGSTARAGYVIILNGSPSGLTADGAQEWTQESPGIDADIEVDDEFGWALAAADFGLSGHDDLAISVPSQDVELSKDAGVVHVLYGSPNGLTGVNVTTLSQSTLGVSGDSEDFDKFGVALTGGDFDNNGKDDLVVGVPFEDVSGETNSGRILVFYGEQGDDLSGLRSQQWYQGKDGVAGANEAGDEFGYSLASGYFGRDSYMDLAIGTPAEDIQSIEDAGAVGVMYGTSSGLSGSGAHGLSHPYDDQEGDRMGRVVTTGDYNADGNWEMAAGLDLRRDADDPDYYRGSVLVSYSDILGPDAGYVELFPVKVDNYNRIFPFRFGWTVR